MQIDVQNPQQLVVSGVIIVIAGIYQPCIKHTIRKNQPKQRKERIVILPSQQKDGYQHVSHIDSVPPY
jgi:hypothetical protein